MSYISESATIQNVYYIGDWRSEEDDDLNDLGYNDINEDYDGDDLNDYHDTDHHL